ncbi:uncharacterized protein LOC111717402, partial [Eurytemora carolleeae]|uniref:uncharacterized protein LOC111717402 n=1 Tax=Eurytemora carolleeae TaxID=1294199 RepID=UPI000C78AB21
MSIAFERWLAVCKPLVHRSGFLAVSTNLPKWFETTVVERDQFIGNSNDQRNNSEYWIKKQEFQTTDLRRNPHYIRYGMVAPRWIFQMLAPFCLLTLFSIFTGLKL